MKVRCISEVAHLCLPYVPYVHGSIVDDAWMMFVQHACAGMGSVVGVFDMFIHLKYEVKVVCSQRVHTICIHVRYVYMVLGKGFQVIECVIYCCQMCDIHDECCFGGGRWYR